MATHRFMKVYYYSHLSFLLVDCIHESLAGTLSISDSLSLLPKIFYLPNVFSPSYKFMLSQVLAYP